MSSFGDQLGSLAENGGFIDGANAAASSLASLFLTQFAKLALTMEWKPGAAEKFLKEGRTQLVMDSTQGRFVLTIEKG